MKSIDIDNNADNCALVLFFLRDVRIADTRLGDFRTGERDEKEGRKEREEEGKEDGVNYTSTAGRA